MDVATAPGQASMSLFIYAHSLLSVLTKRPRPTPNVHKEAIWVRCQTLGSCKVPCIPPSSQDRVNILDANVAVIGALASAVGTTISAADTALGEVTNATDNFEVVVQRIMTQAWTHRFHIPWTHFTHRCWLRVAPVPCIRRAAKLVS